MPMLEKIRTILPLDGLLMTLVGTGILVASTTFPDLPEGYPGPGLFPSGIGILLILSGILICFRKGTVTSQHDNSEKSQIWFFVGILVVVFSFPLVYQLGNFFLALFICISLVATLFRIIWWKSLLISFLTCGSIYLIFIQVLRVPL